MLNYKYIEKTKNNQQNYQDMEQIASWRDISVCLMNKWTDKEKFSTLQKAIKKAFKLPENVESEDECDNYFNYIVGLLNYGTSEETFAGGYRYQLCKNSYVNGKIVLHTHNYYEYSQKFMDEYFDDTIELGRAFAFQELNKWTLLTLWLFGLAPLFNYHKDKDGTTNFLGQVSLPTNIYSENAIKLICSMFYKNFGDDTLFIPRGEVVFQNNELYECAEKNGFIGAYDKDKKKLDRIIFNELGLPKPTLFEGYANLLFEDPKKPVKGLHCGPTQYNKSLGTVEMIFLLEGKYITPNNERFYFSQHFDEVFEKFENGH